MRASASSRPAKSSAPTATGGAAYALKKETMSNSKLRCCLSQCTNAGPSAQGRPTSLPAAASARAQATNWPQNRRFASSSPLSCACTASAIRMAGSAGNSPFPGSFDHRDNGRAASTCTSCLVEPSSLSPARHWKRTLWDPRSAAPRAWCARGKSTVTSPTAARVTFCASSDPNSPSPWAVAFTCTVVGASSAKTASVRRSTGRASAPTRQYADCDAVQPSVHSGSTGEASKSGRMHTAPQSLEASE